VLALVAALRPWLAKISQLTCEIAHRVRAHPHGHVFLSPFRDPNSEVCAAAPLAQIGDCRARYRCAEAIAADAGTTPAAVKSRRRNVAARRRGYDHRLTAATATLATTTGHWHPRAAERYAAATARNHDHPSAIGTPKRARCRVIWRRWQDTAAYQPARHCGLQDHIAVANADAPRPRLDLTATQPTSGAADKPASATATPG
jgi:transposase